MKINFVSNKAAKAGVAVIPVFKDESTDLTGYGYDGQTAQQANTVIKAATVTGTSGAMADMFAPSGSEIDQIRLIGAGDLETFNAEMFAAKAMKSLLSARHETLTLHLGVANISADEAARAAVGVRLAAYRFDEYRTTLSSDKKVAVKEVVISCVDPETAQQSYDNFHGPNCDGQIFARDLVNEPPNQLFPVAYAKRLKQLEKIGLKVEILDEKKMTALGMNALLGVGVGSERESQLVVMHWTGGKKGQPPVCLVGKGVTFDTGGISLKPGANMWDMKGDMGGSAAVSGAMMALAKRKAKANVIGIVGLVENMPDGRAQLPGDIVTSMSGQTIEVQNTDAEGRLVLADALHYARTKYSPSAMINLATLTGAIIVALGHEHAGVFSNNDDLAEQIAAASAASTEKSWRLPLSRDYDQLLDSPNADMKNIGGRAAGSITAAQFLKRFVGDTAWAHIDIAGTGMKNKRTDPRETTFGTGYGVRLLNHWVADNYESE